MNEKTSAEQMYKEYLSEISADPAAIEDILSGERQPANPGARIKHTHGKWAAAVAAAAVMAVTVGVGITSGEDTSPQPSAQTSAPAVTTAAQKQLSPAAEKQSDITASATPVYVTDHDAVIEVKLTPKSDSAKKLLAASADKINTSFRTVVTDSVYIDDISSRCSLLQDGSYVAYHAVCICGKPNEDISVEFYFHEESGDLERIFSQTENPKVNLKKTESEAVFLADNGKLFWLGSRSAVTNYVDTEKKTPEFTLKMSDGSQLSSAYNTWGRGSNDLLAQINYNWNDGIKFDVDNVTSILCDGVEFKKVTDAAKAEQLTAQAQQTVLKNLPLLSQGEQFTTEVIETVGSKHGMCAVVKLTALTEDAKTLLQQRGKEITCEQYLYSTDIGSVNFSTPVISGDSCTIMVSFVPAKGAEFENNISFDMSLKFPTDPEGALKDQSRKVSVTVANTSREIKLLADNGEEMWLTDHYICCGHKVTDREKRDKFTLKYKDGTVKSASDFGSVGGGFLTQDPSFVLSYYLNSMNADNIAAITFDGIEFKV